MQVAGCSEVKTDGPVLVTDQVDRESETVFGVHGLEKLMVHVLSHLDDEVFLFEGLELLPVGIDKHSAFLALSKNERAELVDGPELDLPVDLRTVVIVVVAVLVDLVADLIECSHLEPVIFAFKRCGCQAYSQDLVSLGRLMEGMEVFEHPGMRLVYDHD